MVTNIYSVMQKIDGNINIGNIIASIIDAVTIYFSYIGEGLWWVFLLIGAFLALHMTLSEADIKGALSGLGIILCLILVVDLIIGLISLSLLGTVTQGFIIIGAFLTSFLILALIVSLILLIISFVFRGLLKIRR